MKYSQIFSNIKRDIKEFRESRTIRIRDFNLYGPTLGEQRAFEQIHGRPIDEVELYLYVKRAKKAAYREGRIRRKEGRFLR